MWQQIRNNPRAAILAVLAHVIFVAVLLLSFSFSDDELTTHKGPKLEVRPESIRAEAIDEKQIAAQRKRRDEAEKQRQQKIDAQRRKKEAQLREKKRRAEKKKQQAAEKKRKLAEKKRKQKALAEKKRKAELKKKREREKRLAEEKKRKEAERKRIEEEERKNQQALARQEAEMKQKLAADRQRRAAQLAANQREISKYLGLIKNTVSRYWTLPSTDVEGLSCDVKVRIIPNGEVIDVQIVKSSGNLAFDRSVEKAVYRAAPLPVPSVESGLFDEFREVIFSFEPRGV